MHVLSDFSTIGFNELKNRPKWRKKPNSSTSTGLQKDTFADINRNAIVQKKLGKPFLRIFFLQNIIPRTNPLWEKSHWFFSKKNLCRGL